MKYNILILGSSGMAGHLISLMTRENDHLFNVFTVSRSIGTFTTHFQADITDFEKIRNIILEVKPDFIINCVGLLNKTAEENPGDAILTNSYFPHFLETVTKNSNSRIIHISTDCVFSGKKGQYLESDFKDGVGFYAQTKSLGEINNKKDLTIRTSIIGPEINQNGIGLFDWFSKQNGAVNGYCNVYWSGVTTVYLARFIIEIIQDFKFTGLIHLTNNTPIDKFNLLLLIKNVFKWEHVEVNSFEDYYSDKTLVCSDKDIWGKVPSYEQMMIDMFKWMTDHNHIYNFYKLQKAD
jgi:dTDP-4-dehydrorhamnose reductase